jgi:hypothetical protein
LIFNRCFCFDFLSLFVFEKTHSEAKATKKVALANGATRLMCAPCLDGMKKVDDVANDVSRVLV